MRLSVASPLHSGLPRISGGSASMTSLSRPAQASLTLRPAGLLNRPRRPLSRGFGPAGYPTKPLVSYQVLPTTSWVDPSSTGEPRRWGARKVEEGRGAATSDPFPLPAHQTGRADFPHPAFRLASPRRHTAGRPSEHGGAAARRAFAEHRLIAGSAWCRRDGTL